MSRTSKVLMVASTVLLAIAGPSHVATAQSIQGQVIDSVDQRPLGGTFVYLIDNSGNEIASTIADIDGNFVLVSQQPGSYGLRTEIRGYRGSVSALFRLAPGQPLIITVLLQRESPDATLPAAGVSVPSAPIQAQPVVVPPVQTVFTTEEASTIGALAEFNARRDRGVGRFTTRAEFTATGNPMTVTDVLQRMRGVDVEGDLGGRRVIVNEARGGPRGFGLAEEHAEYCPPLFFRDRRYLGSGDNIDIDVLVPLEEVLAIEVHANTGTLPGTYTRSGSQCGIVAIWTPNARMLPSVVSSVPAGDTHSSGESAPFTSRAWRAAGSVWSSTMFQFLAALGVVIVVFATVGKSVHF